MRQLIMYEKTYGILNDYCVDFAIEYVKKKRILKIKIHVCVRNKRKESKVDREQW